MCCKYRIYAPVVVYLRVRVVPGSATRPL